MTGTAQAPTSVAAQFAPRLIEWQRAEGRHQLPWQRTRDPYRVWLSEIMLQQTQVATVLGYYARFLERYPDVAALARAPLDDVLAQWAGLGYYQRARNLHRCAQAVVAEHGGAFPHTSALLATLPGIGRSTAAAIAAFCFGERAAILDGNVKRVLTRVLGYDGDLAQAKHERALWAMAESLLPDTGIESYTQGLMDLGATLCTARQPACLLCPVRELCAARAAGEPQRYPVKTRRLTRGQREHWWLWLDWHDSVWLVQRPDTGVWAGLWTLPMYEDEPALQAACERLGVHAEPMAPVEHVLTHFDWTLRPYRAQLARKPAATRWDMPGRWVARAQVSSVALPAPLTKLLARG